jgi:hypothetical protein
MTADDHLLHDLRRMWETLDPVPDDLATRALFLLDLENLEYELMAVHGALSAAGARAAETAPTITFSSDSLTVMVTISPDGPAHRRIDGWIGPNAALRITLTAGGGAVERETTADGNGRFVFTAVPPGLARIVVHPTEGAAVRLAHPVVTPATEI